MIYIDYFKMMNDTFGHLAGDAAISRVAAILYESLRAHDIVCRFGGEEFMIFLGEQGQTDGFAAVERMRRAIAENMLDFEGHDIRVTVSIGGSMKDRLEDISLAIRQADDALYRAKASGRTRRSLQPAARRRRMTLRPDQRASIPK